MCLPAGGQRTLISLAFVLAIACSGRSFLYLVDEVDAALDELNQQRVAALVHQELAHKGRGQVLCVSHHPAFQSYADHILQTHMSKEGSIVTQLNHA